MTSSIAGLGPQGSTMAYSVTKAAGLQLMKCLAVSQGPKIRINAVAPGLLLTEWVSLAHACDMAEHRFDSVPKGQNFLPEQIQGAKDKALLKKEVSDREASRAIPLLMPAQTDLEDCANAFIDLAKNSSMTCQTVVVGKWLTLRISSVPADSIHKTRGWAASDEQLRPPPRASTQSQSC